MQCYLNSILQLLFNWEQFRTAVLDLGEVYDYRSRAASVALPSTFLSTAVWVRTPPVVLDALGYIGEWDVGFC